MHRTIRATDGLTGSCRPPAQGCQQSAASQYCLTACGGRDREAMGEALDKEAPEALSMDPVCCCRSMLRRFPAHTVAT